MIETPPSYLIIIALFTLKRNIHSREGEIGEVSTENRRPICAKLKRREKSVKTMPTSEAIRDSIVKIIGGKETAEVIGHSGELLPLEPAAFTFLSVDRGEKEHQVDKESRRIDSNTITTK